MHKLSGSTVQADRMSEWSEIAARLDRLNAHPGFALNADGGKAVYLAILDEKDQKVPEIKQATTPATMSFLSFAKTGEDGSASPETVSLTKLGGTDMQ